MLVSRSIGYEMLWELVSNDGHLLVGVCRPTKRIDASSQRAMETNLYVISIVLAMSVGLEFGSNPIDSPEIAEVPPSGVYDGR